MDNAVALAALTLAGTLAAGFFALVNKQNITHEKIARGLEKVAQSNELIAKETRTGNIEAKERNGHLGDQNLQITQMIGEMTDQIASMADRNYDAIRNVKEQKVQNQFVQTETVMNKDKPNG